MVVLVTGGAGFIGSNFVYYMLNKHPEYRVVCVDKLTYAGNLSTLKNALNNPNFKFYKTDICDRDGIYEIFKQEKPDVVVNFAAESHVDRSIDSPEIFLKTNILGTQVLMDTCKAWGGLKGFTKFLPTKFMGIYHLIGRICFLQKKRLFIRVVLIAHQRRRLIC